MNLQSPAVALAAALRDGRLCPVELLEATLAAIEAQNPALNAVVTLDPTARDQALAAREALRRGEGGPLCGLPVGIKDVTPVAGVRTTYGCPLFTDHVPDTDGPVVARLRAAGAVIVGKTNTPELACGGHTNNPVFGPTRNPWNTDLSPGGSTGGGAAALASGLIALAEGTDMGGSLRIPAAFCGVVGLRPSPGLVPTGPLLGDDLQVSGPMGRTVADVALMLDAIAGDPLPRGRPLGGRAFREVVDIGISEDLRVGWCPDLSGRGVDPSLVAVAEDALARLGVEVIEVDPGLQDDHDTFAVLRGLWMVEQHLPLLDRLELLGPDVAGNIRYGLGLRPEAVARARRARRRMMRSVTRLFEQVDVLATPTVAVPPFPVDSGPPTHIGNTPMRSHIDWVAPTYLVSLLALPALSVPCGLDRRGLPVGLQLVGPRDGEARVLQVGAAVEAVANVGLP
ncbi:MAG: amidase [Alphaproteobacteria bacterium]|nr:amidase [Alphaproteobacteria bacterium]